MTRLHQVLKKVSPSKHLLGYASFREGKDLSTKKTFVGIDVTHLLEETRGERWQGAKKKNAVILFQLQETGCLGYIGDYTAQFWGMIRNHDKDPY